MNQRNLILIFLVLVGLVAGYVLYSQRQPSSVPPQTVNDPKTTSIYPTISDIKSPDTTNGALQSANIYFVALDDNGRSGIKIGCNDSLVPVKRDVNSPEDVQGAMTELLAELLASRQQYFGESGLYNSLYQSNLKIQEIGVENGTATVKLTGQVQLGGTCDIPRFTEQLRATVLQFPTVENAEIFINDMSLTEITSQK